ncbi:MAG: DMT family transporter [Pseudomonadota bacterium]
MTREALGLAGVLVLLGAGWGATQPLAKVATSTGYQPLGLVFWQLAIAVMCLGAVILARGLSVPRDAYSVRIFAIVALIGTVLPNSASYYAITKLPSGLISILLALVPMFAFPMALALGTDRFSALRLMGLLLGLGGVLMIVAPEASLPDPAMVAFITVALIAPLLYALEGNVVAKWAGGIGPIQLLFGSSVLGLIVALPLALVFGQFIVPSGITPQDAAMVASGIVHAVVYTTYVWLVGRAGAVFAIQVSYLVTGFGILWAMMFLGERYSGWVWAAVPLMFAGMFLVQPRPRESP